MKIVHVVPHVDQEASGPSYSVPRLCQSLAALGHDVELSCLAARGEIPGVRLDVHRQWPFLSRFAVSPDHAWALRRKAGDVDIVHNHSLWSMVNIAAGWVVPGRRAKLVTSPRGTLSTWALARRRDVKRLLWPMQRRALARAHMLHATSDEEYSELRALDLRAPVAVIPNGIDVPNLEVGSIRRGPPTVLFLSRIHPKKGLDLLLRAWATLQTRHPAWHLVIAGTGEPRHEREVRDLAQDLALERVKFAGAVYGEAKSRAYLEADIFVLPSHSENFGMVVAEALAHGRPVIVSRGAPWSEIERERCGWWIEGGVADLAAAMHAAMLLPAAVLAEMGTRGRAWMVRDFGWDAVARRMEVAYTWALGGTGAPSWLRLD